MKTGSLLSAYNREKSYEWNYFHAPEPVAMETPAIPGNWNFCGLPVASPLGIPAGPLLNGRWVLYYAGLGFDVLTYKTVRSVFRECYELPNLVPVDNNALSGGEHHITATSTMQGSWAISFGMPSAEPDKWRSDIAWTRKYLPKNKILSVSVVGTMQPGWSMDDLADDYALCARWAVESGADCIEANLSCPNVSSRDGQLYQQPQSAGIVAGKVRDAIGKTPYILKIGHITSGDEAEALLSAVETTVDALAMPNCLQTRVTGEHEKLFFDGQVRGIGGKAIKNASVSQVELFNYWIKKKNLPLQLIGVGGAETAEDIRMYLDAGAHAVHIATAAMVNPAIGISIRKDFANLNR